VHCGCAEINQINLEISPKILPKPDFPQITRPEVVGAGMKSDASY